MCDISYDEGLLALSKAPPLIFPSISWIIIDHSRPLPSNLMMSFTSTSVAREKPMARMWQTTTIFSLHFYEFNIVSKKGRKNLRDILFSFLSFNGSVTWGPYRSKWMCQKHQYINTDEEGSNMMKFISICKIYNCQKLKMMTNMGFRICQKYDLHEDKCGGLRRYFLPAAPL